jgi:hypothetical protein
VLGGADGCEAGGLGACGEGVGCVEDGHFDGGCSEDGVDLDVADGGFLGWWIGVLLR